MLPSPKSVAISPIAIVLAKPSRTSRKRILVFEWPVEAAMGLFPPDKQTPDEKSI